MSKLESKESIEMTIHAAMLIKAASQFVGVQDSHMARLYLQDAMEKMEGLCEAVDKAIKSRGVVTK